MQKSTSKPQEVGPWRNPSRNNIVFITWLDSRDTEGKVWTLKEVIENEGICVCNSVGFLVKKTDEFYCVAPHVGTNSDPEHNQYGGILWIPKVSVVNIVSLCIV